MSQVQNDVKQLHAVATCTMHCMHASTYILIGQIHSQYHASAKCIPSSGRLEVILHPLDLPFYSLGSTQISCTNQFFLCFCVSLSILADFKSL